MGLLGWSGVSSVSLLVLPKGTQISQSVPWGSSMSPGASGPRGQRGFLGWAACWVAGSPQPVPPPYPGGQWEERLRSSRAREHVCGWFPWKAGLYLSPFWCCWDCSLVVLEPRDSMSNCGGNSVSLSWESGVLAHAVFCSVGGQKTRALQIACVTRCWAPPPLPSSPCLPCGNGSLSDPPGSLDVVSLKSPVFLSSVVTQGVRSHLSFQNTQPTDVLCSIKRLYLPARQNPLADTHKKQKDPT